MASLQQVLERAKAAEQGGQTLAPAAMSGAA
jgi:hypothetical protein